MKAIKDKNCKKKRGGGIGRDTNDAEIEVGLGVDVGLHAAELSLKR